MPEKKIEDIKVLTISRVATTGQEFLTATNQGEQKLELTRFPDPGEPELRESKFYRGYVSPPPPYDPQKPDKRRNATFRLIGQINGFGGIEIPFDCNGTMGAMDARQKSILVQSDMKTAAMLMPYFYCALEGESRFGFLYDFIKKFREEQEKVE